MGGQGGNVVQSGASEYLMQAVTMATIIKGLEIKFARKQLTAEREREFSSAHSARGVRGGREDLQEGATHLSLFSSTLAGIPGNLCNMS